MNEKEQNLLNSIIQVVSSKKEQIDEMRPMPIRYKHGILPAKSNAPLSDTKPKSDNTQKIKNLHKAIKTDLEYFQDNFGWIYAISYEIEMRAGFFHEANLSDREERVEIEDIMEYAEHSLTRLDNSIKNVKKALSTFKSSYARLKQLEK